MSLRKQVVALFVFLLSLGGGGSALAQEGFGVTIGVKAWVHNWSTWFNSATPNTVLQTESGGQTTVIPSISLRYNKFFISGDWFPETSYKFPVGGGIQNVKRDEFSIIAGYYIFPELAVAGGFKRVHQNFINTAPPFNMNIDAPVIGLQGGAGIGGTDAFIYGNGFVGPISVSNAVTGVGATSQSGLYYSTELGLGYRISRNVSVTGGYKYQTIRWDNIAGSIPGNDMMSGFIFGLSFGF